MSTVIVVEALGLVTWWGLQRLVGTSCGAGPSPPDVTTRTRPRPESHPGRRRRAVHHRRGDRRARASRDSPPMRRRPAAQALEKARTGGYDLIVLDVMLPDIDGFEVCRRLRSWGTSGPRSCSSPPATRPPTSWPARPTVTTT